MSGSNDTDTLQPLQQPTDLEAHNISRHDAAKHDDANVTSLPELPNHNVLEQMAAGPIVNTEQLLLDIPDTVMEVRYILITSFLVKSVVACAVI